MSEQANKAWSKVPLGKLAKKLVNGGTPPTEIAHFWNGKIPWVTGADFTSSGIGEFRRFVSQEAISRTATNMIERGQLLIVTRTGVGKLAIAPCNIAISQDITGFYVDENQATPEFLYHRMRRGVEDLKKLNQGTSINGIIRADLENYPVELPPLPQQRRIAEILSTVDEAMEQTEALIAKYQQIKAGLMHDLFTRGVTPDGQLRPTSESRRTGFGWIPKAWRIGSLLDVAENSRQPILTGPFGADLGNDDFVADGVPVLRIGNVQQGYLDLDDLLFVSEAKARQLQRYKVNEGDLLFARQGATTGRNALASKDVRGCLINYHIIRVALDHSLCAPLFIEAAFAGEIVKRQVERDKGRGTREGINTAQLKALELPLALVDEQRAIARILSTHAALLTETQNQLQKLRQQKQGLMQDLLTGRVPVRVVESVATKS
jgi:type I restriction enzyme S subunit